MLCCQRVIFLECKGEVLVTILSSHADRPTHPQHASADGADCDVCSVGLSIKLKGCWFVAFLGERDRMIAPCPGIKFEGERSCGKLSAIIKGCHGPMGVALDVDFLSTS